MDDKDPRNNPNHQERGPRRFAYTYDDVERVTGLTRSTLLRKSQEVESLDGVVALALRRLTSSSTELTRDEQIQFLEGFQYKQWSNRWPNWRLYWCGLGGCRRVIFAPGVCAEHGGVETLRFSDKWDVMIRVGNGKGGAAYVPYAWMVLGAPAGSNVSFIDGNRWNCRPMNLRLLRKPNGEAGMLNGVRLLVPANVDPWEFANRVMDIVSRECPKSTVTLVADPDGQTCPETGEEQADAEH